MCYVQGPQLFVTLRDQVSTFGNLYCIWAIDLYVNVIVSYFLAEMFILMSMDVTVETLDSLSKVKVTVRGH